MSHPPDLLQRNAKALTKLFNFNFLNYFHLNAYWIYVLETNHTSINRAVCFFVLDRVNEIEREEIMKIMKMTKKKLFHHFVFHFFEHHFCNGFKGFSSALFTKCFADMSARHHTHINNTNGKQSHRFFVLFYLSLLGL